MKVLSGIANIDAFRNLVYTVNKMKRLNEIYGGYPESPGAFQKWKEIVDAEMRDVKTRFPPNPI